VEKRPRRRTKSEGLGNRVFHQLIEPIHLAVHPRPEPSRRIRPESQSVDFLWRLSYTLID
jgi:hypothetical protein